MILTVTPSPTIDISVEVDHLERDHKLPAQLSTFQPGGGGVNVSRVLHRLGVPTAAVVAVGGTPGDVVTSRLAEAGVDVIPVPIAASTRWVELLQERSTGAEYRLVTNTPTLTTDEWRGIVAAVEARVDEATYLVLSGGVPPSLPPDFVHELARVAAAADVPFVVDTSGPSLAAAIETKPHLVKPSHNELAALMGVAPEELDHVDAARQLLERGAGTVVVSLGPDGAFVAAADVAAHVSTPAIDLVSTVGAGDTMLAGLIVGLSEGRSMLDATRHGVAHGTATCLTPGGEPALPGDVERLEASQEVRVE
jgi:6-phosphofructokinase 2